MKGDVVACEGSVLMTEKLFGKEEWGKVLKGLRKAYRVFVPVKEGDYHNFVLLGEGKNPGFDFQNTRLSAKGIIYPESMRVFEYSLDEKDPEAHVLKESEKDYSPVAVVGVRPCDAHAFEIVERNFDNAEYRDPWWVQAYEATTLVGLGCNEPCATCFCSSVGGGPFGERGLDALMVDLDDAFLVRGLTEKGEAFLAAAKGGKKASKEASKKAGDLAEAAAGKVAGPLQWDRLREKAVNDLFNAPFWEEVGFACLNCGTCTYLCPTCWCFDIQDEVLGGSGDRIRNWDSCMFPLFTLHGSGHNPREGKFQRVRQRFMHKLKYYVDKYEGGVQCSGCGRCVRYCPVNIDIRKVLQRMNSYEVSE